MEELLDEWDNLAWIIATVQTDGLDHTYEIDSRLILALFK